MGKNKKKGGGNKGGSGGGPKPAGEVPKPKPAPVEPEGTPSKKPLLEEGSSSSSFVPPAPRVSAEIAPAAESTPEKAPEPAEKAGADAEAAKAEPAKPADVKVEVDKKEETAPLNAQPGSPVSSESEEKSQGCCIVM